MSNSELKAKYDGLEIAIVGISGRFPGSKNINDFWENLKNGKELISFFSHDEMIEEGVNEKLVKNPAYVNARGVIDDADKFDAAFFGFYPREVEILDPQQRIFLECSWEALEDAGYNPEEYKGLIGVFGGVGLNSYLFSFLNSSNKVIEPSEGYQLSIGNEKDFLTSRVSYKLNLRGPSLDVQTACSTSLVATHLACMNLINYQCDIALAGGATITFPQKSGYLYQDGMILSPDGHCRPFDEKAGGTVAGNGAGIVVLKRLADAIDDGDHIYAVIKGSAYNNDGAMRVGYTAPGVNGQAEVISAAQAMANVDIETISYIETHGTGTSLGDPIEISALSQVFNQQTSKKKFCALGSVKANVGHLDTAAGVAGLIKTALSLYNKTLVPSINFAKPNPKIDFENSAFFVNTELKKWDSNGHPLRAGISSFGIGGTNVHVILEEAPKLESSKSRPLQLLMLSAKTKNALNNLTTNLGEFLLNSEINLADTAYTLQVGRKHFPERRIAIVETRKEAADVLLEINPNKIFEATSSYSSNNDVVFMFSGQGSQYVNMGKELYENEKEFRNTFDFCCNYLKSIIDFDLKEIIYPNIVDDIVKDKINQTYITQPALFVFEYSLAKLLMEWGIKPSSMVGHSIGEYVAATIAGVFELEDALKLVALRGKLMQELPKGKMISVYASETKLRPLLVSGISIAALNGDELTTVSGPSEPIKKMEAVLETNELKYKEIHTSHAFHSDMMDPILNEFKTEIEKLSLKPPVIPYLSNLTGTWIKESEAIDPSYYSKHLRHTVRFSENINNLVKEKEKILLEVGPGNVLITLAKNNNSSKGHTIISTIKHPKENVSDYQKLLGSLGRLWLLGINIDWKNFYKHEQRLRVSLPTYPFEKKRYWFNSKSKVYQINNASENVVYTQNWKSVTSYSQPLFEQKKNYLVISRKRDTLISKLISQLNEKNQSVINIINKDNVHNSNHEFYNEYDYKTMLEDLTKLENVPDVIIFSTIDDIENNISDNEKYDNELVKFESAIALVKVLNSSKISKKIDLIFLTKNLFNIVGSEELNHNQSLMLGLTSSIKQEFKNINSKLIDIDGNIDKKTIDIILKCSNNSSEDFIIGVRNSKKWIRTFESIQLKNTNDTNPILRKNGVYLITGGLGRIGLSIAEYLSDKYNAKLGLLTRKVNPNIENNGGPGYRNEKIQSLIKNDIEFIVLEADVTNKDELAKAVAELSNKFGEINGVFHGAGLTGENAFLPINELNNDNIGKQLNAKIRGAQNLIDVLNLNKLDFIVFHSSIASILGGIGLTTYSAANNYLNSLSERINNVYNSTCISINWDTWKFPESEKTYISNQLPEYTILPYEGLKILNNLLDNKIFDSVIVTKKDVMERLQSILVDIKNLEKGEMDSQELHERPNIATPYRAPTTDLEKDILLVWQNLLGINQIGAFDNFFDLGGNSLLGTQLVSELRQKFQVELPLQSLFDDPTIAGVAKIIESEKKEKGDRLGKLKNVLENIEDLSDAEAEKLLIQKLNKSDGEN